MRILFLTDNFPPEVNAPATRTYEHCREWVKQGETVTVITGTPNFPVGRVYKGYKNRLVQKEEVDGIRVIRVWTYISENKGFVKRILDYLSFMATSFIAGLFIKTDLIVATSPQFFTVVSGRWLSFWKRKKWVMEVRDLWPESIKAVGMMDRNFAIRFFEYLEFKMYRSAWKIITVTDSFRERLILKNRIAPTKIEVIKNGANMDLFQPLPKNRPLLKKLGIEGKFVIGYIGTHGMAHKLDFILDCAKKIEDQEVHFLFLGAGAEKENLLRQKVRLGLENVTMLEPVEKGLVKNYISILDVGLVNLKKSDTFKSVLPSKIFELAAMHKPILLGVKGEARSLVEGYGIGLAFEPENENEFIEKVHYLSSGHEIPKENFEVMLENFNRRNLALKMLGFLRNKTQDE